MTIERTGSTKVMTPVAPGLISVRHTDAWSVFDRGTSPQEIPGLGEARCTCAAMSFGLAKGMGLPTHFVRKEDRVTLHVKEFSVPGREPLSGKTHGRVLPLEWIWRIDVRGSLLRRIEEGIIDPVSLGFKPEDTISEGTKLPHIHIECTTKFEPVDRHLSDIEAMHLADLSEGQWKQAWKIITDAVWVIRRRLDFLRYDCVDGKFELGMTHDGEIVIVDVFGTPDENRILKVVTKKTRELYCKDLIRNHLSALPWKQDLDIAKKRFSDDKSKWPEYPPLPDELVALVSSRYREMAFDYGPSFGIG